MSFYTKKGDDGTTGLLFGGRIPKDSPTADAMGDVDEAQAAIGTARAECERGSELDELLLGVERDLYVLMAELATAPDNRHKLDAGRTLVTPAMVDHLGELTDRVSERFEMPSDFVLPGDNRRAAALDLARAVARRAERRAVSVAADGSNVVPYLNRLSDLLWTLARYQEGGSSLAARPA